MARNSVSARKPFVMSAQVKFIVRAILYAAPAMAIPVIAPEAWWRPASGLFAAATGILTAPLGSIYTMSRATVTLDGFSIQVISQCLALEPLLLLGSFMCAYPATWKRRLAGLCAATSIVCMANIARLTAILALGAAWPALFEYLHLYLGQTLMIVVVVAIFVFWARSATAPLWGPRLGFVVRFFVYAGVLFLFWLTVHKHYVGISELALARFASAVFQNQVSFDAKNLYEYTFGFVTLAALVLATGSMNPWRKARAIAVGVLVLIALQFTFRILAVYTASKQSAWIYRGSVWAYNIAVFLAPAAIWHAARCNAQKHIEDPLCPLCGQSKKGLRQHIVKKHGEQALADKSVIRALAQYEPGPASPDLL